MENSVLKIVFEYVYCQKYDLLKEFDNMEISDLI